MRKRSRILLVVLLVALVCGLAWRVTRPREPVYQGKPLSYWLGAYDHPPLTNVTVRQANEAVRQIGTNAFPVLFARLQQPDSEFRFTIIRLLQKQHLFKFPFAFPYYPSATAVSGFNALGSEASNAVPHLIEIFDSDPHPIPQQGVPVILGHIGPSARQAIPALLRAMSHTNASVRNNAIFGISRIHADPKVVLPGLIKCLNDPDALVRAQAAHALGAMGKDAQPAVTALLALWRNEPPGPTRGGMREVADTVLSSSWANASTPSSFGNRPDVGGATRDALQSIDPEAAAKAGVK